VRATAQVFSKTIVKFGVMNVENCMKRTIAGNVFPEFRATQNEFFSSWVEAFAAPPPLH
jgi:hypothetical protein